MTTVFLTHTPDMLANYYGPRAVAAIQEVAEVRLNPTGRVLDAAGLLEHARGCPIVVSDRQTAGPASFFDAAPDLVAISATSTWSPQAGTAFWRLAQRPASWRPCPRWRSA